MSARNLIIDLRDDGGARLSLSYKSAEQHGICRISCDLSAEDLVQLVLFDGAISLRATLGTARRTELALDGLALTYGGDGDLLTFDRKSGFSSKTALCSVKEFHSEMADITDVCLARAEAARHGAALQDVLAEAPLPWALSAGLDADVADQIFHRIREMALLILAQNAASRGSALARKLRAKKTRHEAAQDVHAVLASLAGEFAGQWHLGRDATRC